MKNVTVKNLETIWQQLDDACGSIDNATTNIALINNIPQNIKDESWAIDLSEIVDLKNKIEQMIVDKKNESREN